MLHREKLQFYENNGYLIVNDIFTKDDVEKSLGAIAQILNSDDGKKSFELEPRDQSTVRRIWSPTQKNEVFWEMATHPKLLDNIQNLIGENILFHYSKLNMKGPQVGSVVEWHQDFSYYPHTNSDLLTALIFLDDASIENGCLRVIPGSHKNGLCSHDIDGYFRGIASSADESQAVHIEVAAGSVLFLHCLTLHASARNESSQPRRTFLPAYRAADTFPIYFGPHAAHNEPGVKLVRGKNARTARVENGVHTLPIAQREFGSIYEIQEGTHLTKDLSVMKTSGYAVN